MTAPMTPKGRVGGNVVSIVPDDRTLLPDAPVASVNDYITAGSGLTLGKAMVLPRTEIIEVVTQAGLRGRGGAGFPAAAKWRGLLRDQEGVKYLCCNAAEGEPATFKDRLLMRANPYRLIEGLAMCIDARWRRPRAATVFRFG